MIITHASEYQITEVEANPHYALFLKGCLCFGGEGNEYNLAGVCNYQYNIEVSNVISVSDFFIKHSIEEASKIIARVRADLGIEATDEQIASLLDGSESIRDFDFSGYDDAGEADWAIQQFQGVLAHALGYDCAESEDEQGTVYIAYCVGRELEEVEC